MTVRPGRSGGSRAGTRVAGTLVSAALIAGCLHRGGPFERLLDQQRWSEAAGVFASDTSLLNDERALYRAGMLYATPGRPTYDPARGRVLLQRLLTHFPETKYREVAVARLEEVDALLRERDSTAARERVIEDRIARLSAELTAMRAELDSVTGQNDALRRGTARLEADLRDRDDQLRLLHTELDRLKAIDLKPPPKKPPR